jgi:pimeloyl-ACP methyl ester carboxylesterase
MRIEQWWQGQQQVAFGDQQVACRVDGEGPDVLLVHGFPTSSYDWQPIVADLADEARLVTVDLLGFGASSKPREHGYSIHEQADVVTAVAAATGIDHCVLVAHDYGATVALELLARREEGTSPFTIDALVLLNGGLYAELHRPRPGQVMLLDPDHGAEVSQHVTRATFGASLNDVFSPGHQLDDAALDEHWSAVHRDDGNLILHELMHYVRDRLEHRERWVTALETSTVPMWFVWGMADPVSGAHMAERINERVGHQTITELHDIGHYPNLESPLAVATAVRAALAG